MWIHAPVAPAGCSARAAFARSFVVNRCPSEMRSISIAIESIACSIRSRRAVTSGGNRLRSSRVALDASARTRVRSARRSPCPTRMNSTIGINSPLSAFSPPGPPSDRQHESNRRSAPGVLSAATAPRARAPSGARSRGRDRCRRVWTSRTAPRSGRDAPSRSRSRCPTRRSPPRGAVPPSRCSALATATPHRDLRAARRRRLQASTAFSITFDSARASAS